MLLHDFLFPFVEKVSYFAFRMYDCDLKVFEK